MEALDNGDPAVEAPRRDRLLVLEAPFAGEPRRWLETAGRIGVTLLVPGGMRTSFFDGRDEQYRPAEDAPLNDPGDVADAVAFALTRPPGCEVRELLIAPDRETSWP